MARTFAELTRLSEKNLIAEHDLKTVNTVTDVNYYLEELRYRRSQKVANQIFWLTLVVTVATVINVVVLILR